MRTRRGDRGGGNRTGLNGKRTGVGLRYRSTSRVFDPENTGAATPSRFPPRSRAHEVQLTERDVPLPQSEVGLRLVAGLTPSSKPRHRLRDQADRDRLVRSDPGLAGLLFVVDVRQHAERAHIDLEHRLFFIELVAIALADRDDLANDLGIEA
jgi:hypothetical protein